MQLNQIKSSLGKIVYYDDYQINFLGNSMHNYVFSGCVLRRNSRGKLFYQAELKDPSCNLALIVPLEKLKVDASEKEENQRILISLKFLT